MFQYYYDCYLFPIPTAAFKDLSIGAFKVSVKGKEIITNTFFFGSSEK